MRAASRPRPALRAGDRLLSEGMYSRGGNRGARYHSALGKPSTSEHGAEHEVWGWWARAQARVSEPSTRPANDAQ